MTGRITGMGIIAEKYETWHLLGDDNSMYQVRFNPDQAFRLGERVGFHPVPGAWVGTCANYMGPPWPEPADAAPYGMTNGDESAVSEE